MKRFIIKLLGGHTDSEAKASARQSYLYGCKDTLKNIIRHGDILSRGLGAQPWKDNMEKYFAGQLSRAEQFIDEEDNIPLG